MKNKIMPLIVLGMSLIGCGQISTETEYDAAQLDKEEVQHQLVETQTIYLNNGEKWEVNDEMMPPIQHMEKSIHTFSEIEEKDYRTLAGNLKKDIDLLTSNCTMTGQGHDELHKWLLPFIDMVNELSEASSGNEEEIFRNIQISFNTFNQYFKKSEGV